MCNDELTHEKIELALEADRRGSKKGSFLSNLNPFGGRKQSTTILELPPPSRPETTDNDDNPLRMSNNSRSSLASSLPVRMPPPPARVGMTNNARLG
jgi:hypothetical protein